MDTESDSNFHYELVLSLSLPLPLLLPLLLPLPLPLPHPLSLPLSRSPSPSLLSLPPFLLSVSCHVLTQILLLGDIFFLPLFTAGASFIDAVKR